LSTEDCSLLRLIVGEPGHKGAFMSRSLFNQQFSRRALQVPGVDAVRVWRLRLSWNWTRGLPN